MFSDTTFALLTAATFRPGPVSTITTTSRMSDDKSVRGVVEMSAYLHHGFTSKDTGIGIHITSLHHVTVFKLEEQKNSNKLI